MRFLDSILETLAAGGSFLFSWLFEHPDYSVYKFLAGEESQHTKILMTLNQSINELRAVNENMASPEYNAIFETSRKIDTEAFEAQKKVDQCVADIVSDLDAATLDKRKREATLNLLIETKAKRMYNDTLQHIKIHNNLEEAKQRFENGLHTQITLLSQAQLRVGHTVKDLNTFLGQQSQLLVKTANMNENFQTFSKVTDHINNAFDYSALTPASISPYDINSMLDKRIEKAKSKEEDDHIVVEVKKEKRKQATVL